jgi:hypothetical protein
MLELRHHLGEMSGICISGRMMLFSFFLSCNFFLFSKSSECPLLEKYLWQSVGQCANKKLEGSTNFLANFWYVESLLIPRQLNHPPWF